MLLKLYDYSQILSLKNSYVFDFVPEELADTLPSADDIEKRIKRKYEIE